GSTPSRPVRPTTRSTRSEEHTSELQSRRDLVCRLLLEKKKGWIIVRQGGEHGGATTSHRRNEAQDRHDGRATPTDSVKAATRPHTLPHVRTLSLPPLTPH